MRCVLLSPERALFDGEVTGVQLPAHDGGMGILPKHAPMIGRLGDGFLQLKTPGKDETFLVFDGFYRISGDVVTVLCADALPAREVKPEAVAAEIERAKRLPARTEDEYRARRAALTRAALKKKASS